MAKIPNWRRYLRFCRPDVDDELRFHFDARTKALRARGHSADDARRLALEEFGDVETTRRGLRETGERMERRRERTWVIPPG